MIARIFRLVVLGSLVLCAAPPASADARQAPATRPAATQPARPTPEVLAEFKPNTLVEADRVVLNYRLLAPSPVEPGREYPLVVVLHGAGERGGDNTRQLFHVAQEFLAARERHPAFVVFPQCPEGVWWTGDNTLRNIPAEPGVEKPLPRVIDLINRLRKELPVDQSRIYITGLSMGGFGTFALVAQLPDTFAAAVPVCGGGDPAWADKLATTPMWIFHGDADNVVPPQKSREMVEAIRRAGGNVQYREYPGVGHDSWTPTYSDPAVMDWMFAQRRPQR